MAELDLLPSHLPPKLLVFALCHTQMSTAQFFRAMALALETRWPPRWLFQKHNAHWGVYIPTDLLKACLIILSVTSILFHRENVQLNRVMGRYPQRKTENVILPFRTMSLRNWREEEGVQTPTCCPPKSGGGLVWKQSSALFQCFCSPWDLCWISENERRACDVLKFIKRGFKVQVF